MARKLSPIVTLLGNDQNGSPRAGAQLFAYITGTQVKASLAVDVDAVSLHTNPIILNSSGEIADIVGTRQVVWQEEGDVLDWVLAPATDSDPPTTPYWTLEAVPGMNDITSGISSVLSQWVTGTAPTFVSATVLSVAGDQTSTYTFGRRVHTTNSGGEIYSTVVSSTIVAGNTQVTLLHDAGSLDAGLSVVQYGLLSALNNAVPGGTHYAPRTYNGLVNFLKGIGPEYKNNYSFSASVSGGALTVTLLGNDGNALSSINPATISFRSATVTDSKQTVRAVSSPLTLAVPSGATLGFGDGETRSLRLYAIDNLGTVELAIANGYPISRGEVVNTTVLNAGSDSTGVLYSTSARTGVPAIFLGRILIQADSPAGLWPNSPTLLSAYVPPEQSQTPATETHTYTASSTWVKPGHFASTARVLIECWGAGGSGAVRAAGNTVGGGGGGSFKSTWKLLSDLNATETVTVGAGGGSVSGTADGNAGGSSSFGSYITAYGGSGGGDAGTGGAGGGWFATAAAGTGINDTGGQGYSGANGESIGGGGGDNGVAGGKSVYGGGGGGGAVTAGGTSMLSGAGGAGTSGTGVAGTAPSGGGGSGKDASGAGARGQVRVTVFA